MKEKLATTKKCHKHSKTKKWWSLNVSLGPFIVLSMRGCQLGFKVAMFEVATFVTVAILNYKSFFFQT
jgi:hypothetical protein